MRHRVTRPSIALLAGACVLAATACATGDAGNSSEQAVPPTPVESPPEASSIQGAQPVLAVDIVQGLQPGPVDVQVDGEEGVSVTFREITIEPGSSTGEHCHHGQLIAVVKQGVFTHYADIYPDGVRIYRAGAALVEGAGYRHEGRNEGMEDVVLLVTYVTPAGKPLSETDMAECEPSGGGVAG